MSLRPSFVGLARLAALAMVLASCVAPRARAAPDGWQRAAGLVDVRHDRATDLTGRLLSEGETAVPLPWSLPGADARLRVGPGWIEVGGGTMLPATALAPDTGQPASPLAHAAAPEPDGSLANPWLRLDVLASDAGPVRLGPASSVLVTVTDVAVAVRFSALETPAGPATVEILLDRIGHATLQYLRLPPGFREAGLRGGIPGALVRPEPASAFSTRLVPTATLTPPVALPQPKRNDPPPAGCVQETGTWCERADGPGTSQVYLSEGFDDLNAASRGWTTTSLWHPSAFPNCTPGASSNPGGSMYFGVDGTCAYQPSVIGGLTSPLVGPITAGTQMTFTSRIEYEGDPFDLAQIYINGTLFANMPTGLDPSLWYNFNPLDLSAWAGQSIRVEFRFTTDSSVEMLGWFVDNVVMWNPTGGNPDCIRNAGHAPYAACSDRVATQWNFNESRFCAGCTYTFYVLVECGREMHLPLNDIEGADIRVTNVEFPAATPPLRCVNQTARADAGMGPYPGFLVGDATGRALDCCPPGGDGVPETWWGPAFDVTDNAGPGRVAWGLSDGCPTYLVYDLNANGVQCSELPPTCGGLLSRVSPGDLQIMDCWIQNDAGLCGLYRVEVISGGNVWSLFANCDGTGTPLFPIFFDCTEAWTAYNPLPELTVANLVVTGGCPNLDVAFDVINVGCADHPGDVVVRIEARGVDASCIDPPTVLDEIIPGPFLAGETRPVLRSITAPCSPARVDVTADPLNAIAECTETPTAAACRADAGVNTVSTFTCGCTAQLVARAGNDDAGCFADSVRLDGSASTVAPCARPLYRWRDQAGAVVRDWSAAPAFNVVVRCPAGQTYTLDVTCEGETCTDSDTVTIACIDITANAGNDVRACTGTGIVLDGSGSTLTNCATPRYRWFDPNGNEVRGWSPDPVLNRPAITCVDAGDWLLEVGCVGETCTRQDFVTLTCVEVLANAGPNLTACDGVPFTVSGAGSTARGCSQVLYQWFDGAGTPISGVLTDPRETFTLNGCPGTAQLVLVAACGDAGFENCGTFDVTDVMCGRPQDPAPTSTPACGGASVACGGAQAGVTYWWDADTSVDADGNTVPGDDVDLAACDGTIAYGAGGLHAARAWARDALGCVAFVNVDVASLEPATPPVPSAEPGCPGAVTMLRCGSAEPTASWDFDIATDSDGNTVPDDDADAADCDAAATYAAGSWVARVTVTAAGGCTAFADVPVTIAPTTTPGEVGGDRVRRSGAALTLTWDPAPGATSYRVSRGPIGTWYDHAADDAAGRGACDTAGLTTFTDPDDATDGANWYYLITAVEGCGLEGTPGDGFDGRARFGRDPRQGVATCP